MISQHVIWWVISILICYLCRDNSDCAGFTIYKVSVRIECESRRSTANCLRYVRHSVLQEMPNQLPVTFTFSLKVMSMFELFETLLAPPVGLVLVTDGAASFTQKLVVPAVGLN